MWSKARRSSLRWIRRAGLRKADGTITPPISIAVVIQGTVWSHDAHNPNCLRPIPTGTVFTERAGEIHNNYNLDPRTPAIVRITHFVDRNLTATRRDQPDPVTGSTTTAAPPPAPCPANVAAAKSSPAVPPRPNAVAVNAFSPPLPQPSATLPAAYLRIRRNNPSAR